MDFCGKHNRVGMWPTCVECRAVPCFAGLILFPGELEGCNAGLRPSSKFFQGGLFSGSRKTCVGQFVRAAIALCTSGDRRRPRASGGRKYLSIIGVYKLLANWKGAAAEPRPNIFDIDGPEVRDANQQNVSPDGGRANIWMISPHVPTPLPCYRGREPDREEKEKQKERKRKQREKINEKKKKKELPLRPLPHV